VLTVPSLDGESIEGFATRVFDEWKLGQVDQDNGVLLIVAPSDRRMRIEVGYGLEGTLTDLQAARIIRDRMTPPSAMAGMTTASRPAWMRSSPRSRACRGGGGTGASGDQREPQFLR